MLDGDTAMLDGKGAQDISYACSSISAISAMPRATEQSMNKGPDISIDKTTCRKFKELTECFPLIIHAWPLTEHGLQVHHGK